MNSTQRQGDTGARRHGQHCHRNLVNVNMIFALAMASASNWCAFRCALI